MFYFIRTVALYLVLFIGLSLACYKGLQHYYTSEYGEQGKNATTPIGFAMSRHFSQPRETETGLVLAGISAQNRRDWGQAWKSFSILNNKYDSNPTFALRAFTLALGNGEYEQALEIANKLKTNYFDKESEETSAESYDLVRLFLILSSIKNGQNIIDFPQFKNGALAKFAVPIMEAWTNEEAITSNFDVTDNIQYYYGALAADYYKKPEVAQALFEKMRADMITDEQIITIADFHLRQNNKGAAIQLLKKYSLVLNRAPELKDRLKTLENTPDTYKPASWSSIHFGGANAGIAMAFHDFARAMVAERAVDSALLFSRMAAYLDEKTPSVFATIGGILKYQKQDDEALDAYIHVEPSDPQYETVIAHYIEILIEQNRLDEAIEALNRSIENNVKNPYYHYLLGNVFKQKKEFNRAVEAYDAAEALGLHDGELERTLWPLYYSRAIAFDLLDRWDDAEADLKTALEKFPNSPVILNYIGYAYADRGVELEKAKDMISRAVMAAPNDAYIMDSMGWILYRMGEYDQAVKYLERAAKKRPYHMVINDHLGDAYWQVGRRLEAQYMWQRALDYYDDTEEEQQRMIEETRRKVKEKKL